MFLLQSVDLFDMGLHDLIKPLIKKSVQAVIADSGKASPNFMIPARTRIKPRDAVGNGPLNGAIIARIKMKVIYFFRTSPITSEQLIPLCDQKRQALG